MSDPKFFDVSDLIGPPKYPRTAVTPDVMEASRARPGDSESADAAFDRVMAEANSADVFDAVLKLYPPKESRPTLADLAAIVPIATARKPRSKKQLTVDIHNAGLLMRYEYGESATSRKYAELVDTNARQIIARDPMPSVMVVGPDGALVPEFVELPGPNCLDTMSARLKLTDEERALFRTRREDAELLLAERAAQMRAGLETP